jgi:hypothetical protein
LQSKPISDAELIQLIVGKIDSLYLTYCDLDSADRAPPDKRNVDAVMTALRKVQSLRVELAHSIPPRLDEIAIAHLRTDPSEWGAKFIDEILALTDNEEDRALAILQRRYNALLPVKVLLENGQRTKSGVGVNPRGHPENTAPIETVSDLAELNTHVGKLIEAEQLFFYGLREGIPFAETSERLLVLLRCWREALPHILKAGGEFTRIWRGEVIRLKTPWKLEAPFVHYSISQLAHRLIGEFFAVTDAALSSWFRAACLPAGSLDDTIPEDVPDLSNSEVNYPEAVRHFRELPEPRWNWIASKRSYELLSTLDRRQAKHHGGALDSSAGRTTPARDQAMRLSIDEIDSFQKVQQIDFAAVAHLLNQYGYFDSTEDEIQRALEQILSEPFHKEDWAGETNDLYSSSVIVKGARMPTAFLLKGRGLRNKVMKIADCGKNGDQILRLFDSPAHLFVVQFVGQIDESVIRDVEGKVELLRSKGKPAWYCVINGQDTARLLHAYGKIQESSR